MRSLMRVLFIAVLALVGLSACSSSGTQAVVEDAATTDDVVRAAPAGRPAFLIAYANW